MGRYLRPRKREKPSRHLCLKEQGVETGFPEPTNPGGRTAAPKKRGSQRSSHSQNVGKQQGWRTRIDSLDHFFLLPSSFLLVSLISQIYIETRTQGSFLVHREEKKMDYWQSRENHRWRQRVEGCQQERVPSIKLPLQLVANCLLLLIA